MRNSTEYDEHLLMRTALQTILSKRVPATVFGSVPQLRSAMLLARENFKDIAGQCRNYFRAEKKKYKVNQQSLIIEQIQ